MSESKTRWSDASYAALETVLRERAGLIFQSLRRPTVEAAALRVMKQIGVDDADSFVALTREEGAVFDDLMAEVTIGETYFFREAGHFKVLRETVLPAFRQRHPDNRAVRVWSAACSTGEEPYSLAITLREEHLQGHVVASDISRERLSAARRGMYRRWSFRGVSETVIGRYFRPVHDAFQLAPEIRRDVEFRYLNLASDCYPAMSSDIWGMDVIFCRNVLIYFDRDTIAHVAEKLLASLSEDGWIFLGATDPPLNEYVACEIVQTEAGLVYRRPRGKSAATPVRSAPAVSPPRKPTPLAPPVIPVPVAPAAPIKKPLAASGIANALLPITAAAEVDGPEQAYKRRDYDRTIQLVAPAAAEGRASEHDLVLYVRALANTGRLEEAGRACAAALDQHRQNAELHYLHAVLVGQSGQHAESARAAKRALYLDRGMIVAHLALGTALARDGDASGASRAFASAERLLVAMPPSATVPSSDGEPAGRLLEMTRLQATLARRGDAA